MPISYRLPGDPRKIKTEILSVPPTRLVRFLGGIADRLQVYVHWVGSYSVPCLGEECELCASPPTLIGYAPVSLYVRRATGHNVTRPAILPVTDACIALLEGAHSDSIYEIKRQGEFANSRMVFAVNGYDTSFISPVFPIRDRMEALWASRLRVPLKMKTDITKNSFADDEDILPLEGVG